MGSDRVASGRPRGNIKEALLVFIVTAVVIVVIIAAFQVHSAESSKEPFPLSNGDYIEYRIQGEVANVSIGGEFIYHFTERIDRGPDYYILTIAPRAPADQSAPFYFKPMLESQYFRYDGENLYCIGDLLAHSLSLYDGANITDLPIDGFGEFVDYQNVNQEGIQSIHVGYTQGDTAHYVTSHNGTTLEQWVANGTGLPIKMRYVDNNGTDITLTIIYTNMRWIEELSRY